jgi:predicted regulator of Ras-like GTPase activity (Roadblock/LC7/MglB family)
MNATPNKNGVILQNGLTLYPAHDQAIDAILNELEKLCKTKLIILTDTSGQLISMHGNRQEADVISLGTLAAGDLAASQEIARLTGELDKSQMIIREGTSVFTFITAIEKEMVLFVQTWRETPPGWSRLLILSAARKIEQVIKTSFKKVADLDLEINKPELMEKISSTLDSMWSEDGNVHKLEPS